MLEVHLDTVTVTSSLNDIRLLTAETCRVRLFRFLRSGLSLTSRTGPKPSSRTPQVEWFTPMDFRNLSPTALLLPSP